MAGLTFTLDQRIKGELLKNPGKATSIYGKRMEKGISEAISMFHKEVIERTPVNLGTLRGDIATEIRGIGLKMQGVVGTILKYSLPVEEGQDPHWPPVAPIILWISRKRLPLRGLTLSQMAFLIRRKISRRGTKGVKMFKNAFEQNKGKAIQILEKAQKEIVNLLGK